MRIIKFRAWDTRKVMKDTPTMRSTEWLRLYFVQEGWFDDEGMEFMQFTGLLDKNGKEIFEHDIVRVSRQGMTGNTEMNADVTFGEYPDPEAFEHGTHYGWRIYVKEGYWRYYTLSDINERCEVIGNVYENPELLK